MMIEIIYALISYLYGSIPFSYIIPKKLRETDVTKCGDGNIGAMNAYYSTKSPLIFLLCLILDISKGILPVIFFKSYIYGFFGILGHVYSIFSLLFLRRVPSGLGMAATLGLLLLMEPLLIPLALIFFVLFLALLNPYKNLSEFLEKEQGNIATLVTIPFVFSLYLFFFNPIFEKKLTAILIMFVTVSAYCFRIKEWLKKNLKL